jgi:3-hydroxybutyryl-CoA dehydrogenase
LLAKANRRLKQKDSMEIGKIGVVGAGQMGSGIAQVFAASGLQVVMTDVSDSALQRGRTTIETSLARLVAKSKLDEAAKGEILARVETGVDVTSLADADVVIEAATENLGLKEKILGELDRVCRQETIIATNTSSVSLTRLAASTARADRVIGMHFFNPVPMMQLVEVIRALQTSDATYRAVEDLARRVGKSPVSVKNSPGFVANRILLPMINEAVFTLYEGLASPADIDTVMKLGMSHPIGPLALADLIGLDTCLAILETLYDGFCDPKYRPCPLLVEMVEAGRLGRKSGRGFFDYSAAK